MDVVCDGAGCSAAPHILVEGGPGCNSQQPIPVTSLLVPARAQNLLKQDHLGTSCPNI